MHLLPARWDVEKLCLRSSRYEKKVKDYNFGSLIRTDARQEYSETNTIFVTRIQVRRLSPSLTTFLWSSPSEGGGSECSCLPYQDAHAALPSSALVLRIRDRAQPAGPERQGARDRQGGGGQGEGEG